VGNPPFIGAGAMRGALGEGYVDALRGVWPKVPESADFVMYWWHRAAALVGAGKAERFGLITTNSLRQTFNRRVVQLGLAEGLSLRFAVPDHPWVDSANGAAVRIAMTVASTAQGDGKLMTVTQEQSSDHGEVQVEMAQSQGLIHADLRIGANVAAAVALRANMDLRNRGVQLFGAGFILTPQEAHGLGLGTLAGLEKHIRQYLNGRDLTSTPRGVMVIDMFGLGVDEVRVRFPAAYQWLLERVKPERDQNNRETRRKNWWLFGETNPKLRRQLRGLPRYIATVETAKHRVFQFLDINVLPDNKLVAIALSDALHLGVLSSRVHGAWALAAGSWLGVGNDPVYVKSRCFEAFPFPTEDTGLTPALAAQIRSLAEQLDAHRKARQAAHTTVTITGMYNVLDRLRSGQTLTAADRTLNDTALVGVLRSLHDELDAAVLAAYGWSDLALPTDVDALLLRLVDLNTRRAKDEAAGTVRWLRPDFQLGTGQGAQTAIKENAPANGDADGDSPATAVAAVAPLAPKPWPAGLADQIKAVADALASAGTHLDLDALATRFSGRGRWRERLPTILDALVALGRARVADGGAWVDAGR
jgi:hypothetical protein